MKLGTRDLCRRYPDVVQPVVATVNLSVPLLRGDGDAMEETWHRCRLMLAHDELAGVDAADSSRAHDATLIRLLNAAITSGKQHRALDLVMNMRTPIGLNLAHTLASKQRLSGLAERIDRVRQDREAALQEEEEEEVVEEEQYPGGKRRSQCEVEEEEEVEESVAKRACVSFKAAGEDEEVGTDDDDAGRAVGDNIGTPPAPAGRRESGNSVPFFKKTPNQVPNFCTAYIPPSKYLQQEFYVGCVLLLRCTPSKKDAMLLFFGSDCGASGRRRRRRSCHSRTGFSPCGRKYRSQRRALPAAPAWAEAFSGGPPKPSRFRARSAPDAAACDCGFTRCPDRGVIICQFVIWNTILCTAETLIASNRQTSHYRSKL
jgi:hypothetical protein